MNFLTRIIAVCGSFNGYRDIRDQPVSSSIKYLLQLMALLALIVLASFVPWLLNWSENCARWADKNFPAFRIEQDKVVTDVAQPYRAGGPKFLFILDTTGKVTEPDASAAQGLLVMADSFLFWMKPDKDASASVFSQRQSLRGFPEGAVTGDYFMRIIHAFLWVGVPLGLISLVIIGAVTALLQAYLFSFVASLSEQRMPAPLQLRQLFNIAIHAVTPAAIIFTVYLALRLEGLDLWLIYLIAYGIFLVGATNACHDNPAPQTREESDFF
jgi:hypothetical protein